MLKFTCRTCLKQCLCKSHTAVCEKCGAIGVKHAFYTKERRFCSRACARSSEHTAPTADSTYSPSHSVDQSAYANQASPNESKIAPDVSYRSKITVTIDQGFIRKSCNVTILSDDYKGGVGCQGTYRIGER